MWRNRNKLRALRYPDKGGRKGNGEVMKCLG